MQRASRIKRKQARIAWHVAHRNAHRLPSPPTPRPNRRESAPQAQRIHDPQMLTEKAKAWGVRGPADALYLHEQRGSVEEKRGTADCFRLIVYSIHHLNDMHVYLV